MNERKFCPIYTKEEIREDIQISQSLSSEAERALGSKAVDLSEFYSTIVE